MNTIALFLLSLATPAVAGYSVSSRVDPAEGSYRYTWTITNHDQDSGLDLFVVAVPSETRVLARNVPAPYSNPEGSGAHWIFLETHEAQVDPIAKQPWIAAAPAGSKYLVWCGQQPPSVYPPGTTVTFSLITDSSVKPGSVRGVATTYTPQTNPYFYAPFHNRIVGPAAFGVEPAVLSSSLFNDVPFHRASPDLAIAGQPNLASNPANSTLNTSLALYPGVTIEGEVGRIYAIQFSTALDATWRDLTNITLSSPRQIWFDPQNASAPRRFYRVLPASVVVP